MNPAPPSWHLLGAGSLGCLIAAYLRRAGIAIELIVRDENAVLALRDNGGITLTPNAAFDAEPSTIAIDTATSASLRTPIRQLLVCTKAQQTLAAISAIKSRLAADAIVVLLQNGMGVRESLQRDLFHDALSNITILHALSTEGAFRTARFHVTHAGLGETLIGSIDAAQHPIAQYVAQSLQCERPLHAVENIGDRLWLKLAVNSVINPLTAIHHCRNGELLALPDIDTTIATLCAELAAIAAAEHIDVDAIAMRAEVYRVIAATAKNKSSMLQDIEANRASEIDFISGFIVQRANRHKLPCAAHERLLQAVRTLQA